ncbi:GNAT family N-acetyltransferase [Streptomyces sp. HU2014]|uniref:GNAT family N-acetyltransferase n=1 Tax=Streptomyces sp. HU2014 TaxID=2939414 RepID=UPI00200F846E|nr:GNAT family N-acetyltransferase [Streptomyces sp. HU2014]UQI47971.1 GNAT family N-acetyltransferase [Streptomyces sp. HU2014]
MTTPGGWGLVHHGSADLSAVREMLLDVHDEVYADSGDPLAGREQFARFLDHWSGRPGFSCVVGYAEREPIGYAYGAPLSSATTWWKGVEPRPDPAFTAETGSRTFALSELMVRAKWRATGHARRIHDALLAGRAESRVTLLVHQSHPKVCALYETWGYEVIGETTPSFPAAPALYVMVLRRGPAGQ